MVILLSRVSSHEHLQKVCIMDYPTLFVGIDVSKHKHDIAILNGHKQLVFKPFVITNDYQNYQELLHKFDSLSEKYHTKKFCIGLEATGDYWKNIYYFLKRQSNPFGVTVINPVQTKAFTKTELRRAKTDPISAKDIALFMAEKQPPVSFDRPAVFDIIKDIDRQIYQFKKQQTMTANKLRIELTKVAPEIEKAINKITGQQILALLRHYPTAEAIANASVDKMRAIRYGKKQWALPLPFVSKIKALAQRSIAYKTGTGSGCVVQSLARSIEHIQDEVQLLKRRSVELYHTVKEHQSLLATIPGITHETAIVLEAYIGDVNRFSHMKKFVAYFGMNPTVNQSGKSKRASHLQKKGSPIVRHKLFLATLCMINRKIAPIYPYYRRLVDSGKPKLVAVGAAMRKLLVIIYFMLKNNSTFKPNNY